MKINSSTIILIADDDADDQYLIQEICDELDLKNVLQFAADGEELLDTLFERIENMSPLPGLILLDLNMPRKNGLTSLEEIKSNPQLKHIPIVILTTSRNEDDIQDCYQLGAAGIITKPAAFNGLVNTIKVLNEYWFQIVKLPGKFS